MEVVLWIGRFLICFCNLNLLVNLARYFNRNKIKETERYDNRETNKRVII